MCSGDVMEFSFCMCNISRISLSHPTSFHYSTVWVLLVSTVNKLSLVVLQDFCPEVRCLFTTHLTYSGEHEWIRVCLSPCTCRLEALSHLYYLFSANLDSFSKSAYLAHICGDSHLIWRSIKKQNYWAKPFDRDSLTSPFFSCCVSRVAKRSSGSCLWTWTITLSATTARWVTFSS